MPTPIPESTEAEIEALDERCRRLAGFRDGVDLEWVDGFMTALLAGPRTISPSEWIPAMLGDAFARAFADPEDVQRAMDAFLARWNVIARQLDPQALLDHPDELRLAPLVADHGEEARAAWLAEGELTADELGDLPPTGTIWAEGFLAALDAFPLDWPEPDVDTVEGREYDDLLMGIVALTLDGADLDEYLAGHRLDRTPTRDELIDEACWCVQDLRLYWIDHAPRHEPIRVGPKPGRNDPCPCGSGKKYKKCCGAAAPP